MSGAVARLCHAATAEIAVSAADAIAYMSDGLRLGTWSFGCWETRRADSGLFVGRSLFDGGETWVRIDAAPVRLAITYHVGRDPGSLVPRIMVVAVPGAVTGRSDAHCLLTLLGWRHVDAADERWRQMTATHETEILLIKAQLERSTGET